MKIAIVTPSERSLWHRVRGSGFYIENLKKSLLKYDRENKYFFYQEWEEIPKEVELVHYPYFEPFFLTLSLFKNRKTIVTVHDLTPLVFPKYFPKGIKGALKWQIQKRSLKNVDAIITDSNSSKKDIMKFTGIAEKKIHTVYLAASDVFKRIKELTILDNIQNKYRLPEKFVLYVGDVTWNKNLPRLISAIKEINVTLVMAGSAIVQKDYDRTNPWNRDLDKAQKMTEGNKLFLKLGFVSDADLIALYNLATVFVMPSIYEGFGLPILEAMKCGCPVITTREGSLAEVGGDAVYYVDTYDVINIANAIGEVYFNTKIAKELSQKGQKQAKKFSWEKTARETVTVYKKILE